MKNTNTPFRVHFTRFGLPLLGAASLLAFVLQSRSIATPDAAGGPVAAPLVSSKLRAESRVVAYPGSEVTVSTEIGGTIARLLVDEKQVVKRGDLILELRSDDHRAALEEARARARESEADVRLAESEQARAESLHRSFVGSRQTVERADRDVASARARLETARATTRRLEAVLAKTRITAPIDGIVITRAADAGESIEPGRPLVTIADLSKLRIEAEVDEFDAGRVVLGAAVTVRAEGWDGASWRGRVEEIPDTVTSRRLKPQDPGRPIDTRVLLVKVALDEAVPLKLGQRCEASIETKGRG